VPPWANIVVDDAAKMAAIMSFFICYLFIQGAKLLKKIETSRIQMRNIS
jgi:hypothetical protein